MSKTLSSAGHRANLETPEATPVSPALGDPIEDTGELPLDHTASESNSVSSTERNTEEDSEEVSEAESEMQLVTDLDLESWEQWEAQLQPQQLLPEVEARTALERKLIYDFKWNSLATGDLCTPCKWFVSRGSYADIGGTLWHIHRRSNCMTGELAPSCALCWLILTARSQADSGPGRNFIESLGTQAYRKCEVSMGGILVTRSSGSKKIDLGLMDSESGEETHQDCTVTMNDVLVIRSSSWNGLNLGRTEFQDLMSQDVLSAAAHMRIPDEQRFDASLLRSWISACEHDHGSQCNDRKTSGTRKPIDIVLIDVHRECLITASTGFRYLALNYVWGGVYQLQLTRSRWSSLSEKGGLSVSRVSIPQTIRDAMELVAAIDEDYLWVDSLCVAQDVEAEKHYQISNMSAIYSGALATIVAVAGHDADAGLPGVRPGSRSLQVLGDVCDLRLAKRPASVSDVVFKSVYNTRAWTFQERILSRRCLYLTKEQVYFQCSSKLWCEDRNEAFLLEKDFRDLRILKPLPSQEDGQAAFKSYAMIAAGYTKKNLSYSSDAINAFSGITKVFEKELGWKFFSGLPGAFFLLALLWVPSTASATCRPKEFLSRAWAACEGPVDYMIHFSEQEFWFGSFKTHVKQIDMWEGCAFRPIYEAPIIHPSTYFHWNIHPDPDDLNERLNELTRYRDNTLRFRTSIVPMKRLPFVETDDLSSDETEKLAQESSQTLILRDCKGRHCGLLYGITSRQLEDRWISRLNYVLLSGGSSPWSSHLWSGPYFSEGTRSICNVLLVACHDGQAERLAIGQIHVRTWKLAHPVEQWVNLQ